MYRRGERFLRRREFDLELRDICRAEGTSGEEATFVREIFVSWSSEMRATWFIFSDDSGDFTHCVRNGSVK